jgi:hypothetical protein
MPALQTLLLDGNGLGNDGVAILARALCQLFACPQLRTLVLAGNQINKQGADALATVLRQPQAAPALHTLNLDNNRIGDDDVTALAEAIGGPGCPALRVLCLRGNPVSAANRRRLTFTRQLLIYLPRRPCSLPHQLGDLGVLALERAVLQQASLDKLHLDTKGLNPNGVRALENALARPGEPQQSGKPLSTSLSSPLAWGMLLVVPILLLKALHA